SPSKTISPASVERSPMSILSMTLLPLPDAPRMVVVAPFSRSRFRSEKMTLGPKAFRTPQKRMRIEPTTFHSKSLRVGADGDPDVVEAELGLRVVGDLEISHSRGVPVDHHLRPARVEAAGHGLLPLWRSDRHRTVLDGGDDAIYAALGCGRRADP